MMNAPNKAKFDEQVEQLKDFNVDDCFECRMFGGGAAILMSVYVVYGGYRRHANATRPILSRAPSVITSVLLFSLGMSRLLNYNLPNIYDKLKSINESE